MIFPVFGIALLVLRGAWALMCVNQITYGENVGTSFEKNCYNKKMCHWIVGTFTINQTREDFTYKTCENFDVCYGEKAARDIATAALSESFAEDRGINTAIFVETLNVYCCFKDFCNNRLSFITPYHDWTSFKNASAKLRS